MNIQTVVISGFRCFGTPVLLNLAGSITTIVGANGSGKTALLQALSKLFSITRAQRTVTRGDFHVPPTDDPADRKARSMFIDVIIGLPELSDGSATAETIAPAFKYMVIAEPGKTPVCRMRLEAQWVDDGTVDGEVTQRLDWITKLGEFTDEHRSSVSPTARGLIQLHYTPASRDAASQIKASTGALAARLLRAINWSNATRTQVEAASDGMQSAFSAETGVAAISNALSSRWEFLNADTTDIDPKLALTSRRFEEIVRNVTVMFERGPAGLERGIEMLSDGQQSLFYFALAAAVFDVEREAIAQSIEGFDASRLVPPALTIFAIEEPENHLSPFYLSRIIEQLRTLLAGNTAQAILTSHSPGVLSRIQPEEVRYCRRDQKTGFASVKSITLPATNTEAIKFVRGAMLAYPELYFAKFVVLGEGDSEQVVLPLLAKSLSISIDTSFVAIVPLGGRHVHHFWRLLKNLDIPHATLLDLDIGRNGGGFGRVKTAIKQLLENGADRENLLKLENGSILELSVLEKMHTWTDPGILEGWIDELENFGVYFSAPLDLDMEMLMAYPWAYEALIPVGGGPDLTVDEAALAVLSKGGLTAYDGKLEAYKAKLPAYRYHFLTHSKPATHLGALTAVDPFILEQFMPSSIQRLLEHVSESLKQV